MTEDSDEGEWCLNGVTLRALLRQHNTRPHTTRVGVVVQDHVQAGTDACDWSRYLHVLLAVVFQGAAPPHRVTAATRTCGVQLLDLEPVTSSDGTLWAWRAELSPFGPLHLAGSLVMTGDAEGMLVLYGHHVQWRESELEQMLRITSIHSGCRQRFAARAEREAAWRVACYDDDECHAPAAWSSGSQLARRFRLPRRSHPALQDADVVAGVKSIPCERVNVVDTASWDARLFASPGPRRMILTCNDNQRFTVTHAVSEAVRHGCIGTYHEATNSASLWLGPFDERHELATYVDSWAE